MPTKAEMDAHRASLRAETEARKALVRPLVPRVLERARDLLDDRSRWTRGTVARTEGGAMTKPDDPSAVTWCAVGALDKCAREVWAASALSGGDKEGWSLLFHVAQEEAAPHIAQAAHALGKNPEAPGRALPSIPHINDSDKHGGYAAVINGLYLATGRAVSDRVALFMKRSQAARKAWETRRAKEEAQWRAYLQRREEDKQRKAREALEASQVMVFGGTSTPVSPPINADANKEIAV